MMFYTCMNQLDGYFKSKSYLTELRICIQISGKHVNCRYNCVPVESVTISRRHLHQRESNWTRSIYFSMKDGIFLAVDFFGGSGSMGRALTDIHRSRTTSSKTLMIDSTPLEEALAIFPILQTYIDGGSIVYFQMDLFQFEESDVQRVIKFFLNAELQDIDWIHVSADCSTFSYAGFSAIRHRTNEGAPLTAKAIHHTKTIQRFFLLARWYVRVQPKGFFTFENPEHGSFRTNNMVQDLLLKPQWMMFYVDYCSVASSWLGDGDQPKKRTVILAYGMGIEADLPLCAGTECPMVVPGTMHHRLVVCNRSEGLQPGQSLIPAHTRSIIPKGLIELLLDKHFEWLADNADGYSAWCIKCGDGGEQLLMCDGESCTRVQHRSCPSFMASSANSWNAWFCDFCCMDQANASN